ncbi:hypothetical protein J8F10_14350 [Gemmata sp. G18]|uniref:Uncharacterized protein n=1 Tax=Gemmata palustris TaxID=2822762 RepID=A0ABS5BUA3_9BACT|nr:hypothetical protein [Gemmata palustris]MBP3956458.1 hypothetical protein [Gemmata palustris]
MKKPPAAGSGRKKGSKNRTTVVVKEALEMAFHGLGGVPALIAWAQSSNDNFSLFYEKMWLKLLPTSIDLNRPAPQPHTQPINDPNVLDAALAFDAAVAGTHTHRAGTARPPVPHLGEVPSGLAKPLDAAADEAAAVPTRAPESGQAV